MTVRVFKSIQIILCSVCLVLGPSYGLSGRALADEETKPAESQEKKEYSHEDHDNIANLTAVMLSLAVGFVATTSYLHCESLALSYKAFMAGGVTLILGEVMNLLNQKKSHQKVQQQLTDSDEMNKQIQSLQSHLQANQDRISSLKKRASMQNAAGVAFLLAAGIATYEKLKTYSAQNICWTPDPSDTYLQQCNVAKSISISLKTQDETPYVALQCLSTKAQTRGMHPCPKCLPEAMLRDIYAVCCAPSIQSPTPVWTPRASGLEQFANSFLNWLLPNAYAQDYLNTMGLVGGGVLAAVFASLYPQTKDEFARWVGEPGHRALVFGGFSLLAFGAAQVTKSAIQKYKKDNEELEALIKKYIDDYTQGQLDEMSEFCMSPSGRDGALAVDEQCLCRQSNTCFASDLGIPDEGYDDLSNQALIKKTLSRLDNTVRLGSQGQQLAMLENAQALASQEGAVRGLTQALQDNFNQALQARGESPVNFAGEQRALASGLSERAQEIFVDEGAMKKLQKEFEQIKISRAKDPLLKPGGGEGTAGLSLGLDHLELALSAQEASLQDLQKDANARLQVEAADIHPGADKNLFEVISSRYLHAIPRLAP